MFNCHVAESVLDRVAAAWPLDFQFVGRPVGK